MCDTWLYGTKENLRVSESCCVFARDKSGEWGTFHALIVASRLLNFCGTHSKLPVICRKNYYFLLAKLLVTCCKTHRVHVRKMARHSLQDSQVASWILNLISLTPRWVRTRRNERQYKTYHFLKNMWPYSNSRFHVITKTSPQDPVFFILAVGWKTFLSSLSYIGREAS